ncbi:MAG: response regulator transcription factor [Candidatus Krumholzibacteria bacterium]|nr:response regulator transcription factor [Candidatus Krumholzibacteria bacterium]
MMKASDTMKEIEKPDKMEGFITEIEKVTKQLQELETAPIIEEAASTRLVTIENNLKKLEALIKINTPLKSTIDLNDFLEKIIIGRINADRNTILQALNAVCTHFLENPLEAEKMNKVINSLCNVSNGTAKKFKEKRDTDRATSSLENDQDKPAVSRREKDIIYQLLEGKSNREISEGLCISEKTVKNHLWKIYRKFEVKNRTQLFHKLIH